MSAIISITAYEKRGGHAIYHREVQCKDVRDATRRVLRDGFKRCTRDSFKKKDYLQVEDGTCRYATITAQIVRSSKPFSYVRCV